MAEIRYDISQLHSKAFGIAYANSIKYLPGAEVLTRPDIKFDGELLEIDDEEQVFSYLGTPVMFTITFEAGTYQYYEDGEILTKEMDDYVLPFSAVADFQRSKRKRSTPINGGKGSVKEVSGHNDWQIRIRGMILPEQNNRYDGEALQRLLEWEELADAPKVSGKMFEYLGIYNMDIESISLPKLNDAPFVQAFEIRGESDEPTQLIL